MDEFFDFDQASRHDQRPALDAALGVPTPESCVMLSELEHADLDLPEVLFSTQPGTDTVPAEDDVAVADLCDFENFNQWIPSISKPAYPCDYCASRRLECLFLYQGQTTCSSCTSLFRECSFSHALDSEGQLEEPPPSRNRLDTLHPVREDVVTSAGALTGKRNLRSKGGVGGGDDNGSESRSKKSNPRFSKDAVRVLKNWLSNHALHPYPTDDEKDELKKETGLKRSQISNWLANARRRGKVRPTGSISPSLASSYSSAVDIPVQSSLQTMSPLERWQRSPPEHEPASVSAIANAVATSDYISDRDNSASSSWTNPRHASSAGSTFSVFRAPSLSSLETMRSSGSDFSFGSVFSNQSQHSFSSIEALNRKEERRRRRRSTQARHNESRGTRMFQCAFCTARFKTKHDWQRHEKSFHLSLEKWTCAPLGGLIATPAGETCVFCNATNPPPGHLETHNFEQCSEKSPAERTFYRKDHLRQHLRLTHACSFDVSMESWKATKVNVRSRCGFCSERFVSWQARVDHLAAHFRAGAEMVDWQGDWGLDPAVMIVLDNAVPPWLTRPVGDKQLSTAKNYRPFQQLVTPPDDGAGSNFGACSVRLANELGQWTRERLEQGAPPTDDELQAQSRWIIYMSPDPWNVTAADDIAWLARFKRQNGLSPVQEDFAAEQMHEGLQMPQDEPMPDCLSLQRDFEEFVF
ncbi:MAG: hypothetical protein M4579_000802 [Chaenotheca gracillima]|nr:MAG: hypothetical protein M4579_000802 [Chaenotheca gracillima]